MKRGIVSKLLLSLVLICSLCVTIQRLDENSYESFYNDARIILADDIKLLQEGREYKEEYAYIISDLAGIVTYVYKTDSYAIGESVNMMELIQLDQSYLKAQKDFVKVVFPLSEEKHIKKFAVFFLSKDSIAGKTEAQRIWYMFSPVFAGTALIFFYFIGETWSLKRHVYGRIKKVSKSARAIIEGNYEVQPAGEFRTCGLNSEMDELVHGFQLMQDELNERRKQEERLKKMQKELISVISHDLKTPISTMKAYGEALRDGIAKEEEDKKRYLNIMLDKIQLMNKMISDLLEHSNAELNQLSIGKRECDFHKWFEGILDELDGYMQQQKIQFYSENNVPDVLVYMDETRISQVIYNLVENAIKYIGDRGTFISVKSDYAKEDRQVIISIQDDGPGIAMDDIPYVFDKFFRAERSRSSHISGSGLGLSICKYIIEHHDGKIECYSKSEQGTTFVVRLNII